MEPQGRAGATSPGIGANGMGASRRKRSEGLNHAGAAARTCGCARSRHPKASIASPMLTAPWRINGCILPDQTTAGGRGSLRSFAPICRSICDSIAMIRARTSGFGAGLILLCAARILAADARCPASFAKASGACDERASSGAQACVYPEGTCSCARSTPCSGVPRPPGEPSWRCRAARTDGCPDDAPAQGGVCAAPGKICSYGDCGSLAYTCDPQKRTWFISGGTAPPPSAPGGGVRPPAPPPLPPPPPERAAAPASRATWKTCPARTIFRCTPRSQGAAPPRGEAVPQVCGCIPRCPASRPVLIAFEADGHWPDGSRKGRFICATAGIPSASPARGM